MRYLLLGLFLCASLMATDHKTYLPHFTSRSGEWETLISLVNPNSVSADVELTAYGNDGTQLATAQIHLPPHASLNQMVGDLFQNLSADNGWVSLSCNRENLEGLMIFTNVVTGGTSSLPLLKQAEAALVLPFLENSEDIISGMVLTNPTTVSVDVQLTLDDQASDASQTSHLTLAPWEKRLGTVAQFFGESVPAKSSLRVLANGPVTGLALIFHNQMQQIVAVPAASYNPGKLLPFSDDVVYTVESFPSTAFSAGFDSGTSDPLVVSAGLADLTQGTAMRPDHSADIGSITKSFIATLFMMYEEEGLLSVEDKLSKWMPQFPKSQQISLRMLLNHTSGIANYTDSEQMTDDLVEDFGNNLAIPPQRLLDYALAEGDGGFVFEPGVTWGYSNTNYILLGMIAETVGQDPLQTQLHARIFDVLGMRRTFLAGAEAAPGRAHQYIDLDDEIFEVSENVHMSWAWSAGAIASTPEDMMTFIRALFTGQLVSEASLTKMTTPTGAAISASYGFGLVQGSIGDDIFWGHGGGTYGGQALLLWFPNRQASLAAVVTNTYDENGFDDVILLSYGYLADLLDGSEYGKVGRSLKTTVPNTLSALKSMR